MKPVCLVIGAGAGIGGTVARRFAQEGYHACLCRRSDSEGLNRLVNAIKSDGGSATGFLLNATQVKKITAPALIVESDEDEFVPDAHQIYDWLTSPKTLKIYPNDDSHGVLLFDNHNDLFPTVLQFLQYHNAEH